MNRLFVPLNTENYNDFKYYGKSYELRNCERNFKEKFVYSGREVEIRKGYSGESLWGRIGKVITGNLERIFSEIDFKLIQPRANSLEEAIKDNEDELGEGKKKIAFEILFNHEK